MRTLTVKQGKKGEFVDKFPPGWHTLTISEAEYGEFNGTKFISFKFSEYADNNINCRIWAKSCENGEEFAIGNVFRFANAGITEVLEGTGGDKVVKLDDSAEQMVGKHLNIFFYKDGEYTRAYSSVAPTVFENAIDKFTQADVDFWKTKAETRFNDYTPGNGTVNTATMNTTTAIHETDTKTNDVEIPF